MQWHKTLTPITLLDCSELMVAGMACEGLLIHKASNGYRITHIDSGCMLDGCRFDTYRAAREKADQLHSLESFWSKSLEDIASAMKQPGSHRTKIQAILGLSKEPESVGPFVMELLAEREKALEPSSLDTVWFEPNNDTTIEEA